MRHIYDPRHYFGIWGGTDIPQLDAAFFGDPEHGWQRAVKHCEAADVWLDFVDVGVLLTRSKAEWIAANAGESLKVFERLRALISEAYA